jgi:hypothetical protein
VYEAVACGTQPGGKAVPRLITNARTEGYNRLVKTVKRSGCGFPKPRQLDPTDTIPPHPQTAGRNPDFMLIARSKSKGQNGGFRGEQRRVVGGRSEDVGYQGEDPRRGSGFAFVVDE